GGQLLRGLCKIVGDASARDPRAEGMLEDVLCQINSDSRRVHHLDSFWLGFSCYTNFSLTHRCRTAIQEESISTLEGSVMRLRFGASGAWGQCAPAALFRRGRPAPQLHR